MLDIAGWERLAPAFEQRWPARGSHLVEVPLAGNLLLVGAQLEANVGEAGLAELAREISLVEVQHRVVTVRVESLVPRAEAIP